MSADEKPASKIYFRRMTATGNGTKEETLSTESQTNRGAMTLFKQLKKEMKIE